MRFSNGDFVQYDTPSYGKGKGTVVGYHKCDGKDMWVVYRKMKKGIPKSMQPNFLCIVVRDEEMIATPF